MRLLRFAVFIAASSFTGISAGFDFDGGKGSAFEPAAVRVPPPSAAAAAARDGGTAEWTVMVYMNGKNDLEYFGLLNLNEMETVGSTPKVNIVTEIGRSASEDSSDGDWKGVRRYYVTKDADTEHVSSRVVGELGQTDMGDYRNLSEFGRWAKQNYPARHYMLIVWNHGSGWLKGNPVVTRGISYDLETGHNIDTPQLGKALAEIGHVDIFAADACLMQMAEVAYQLKDGADYILASEESENAYGYPYSKFLARLAAKPDTSALDLAKSVVDTYVKQCGALHKGGTMSVVNSAALPGLAARLNAWTAAVERNGDKSLIGSALEETPSYADEDNKDLYRFTELLGYFTTDPGVRNAGEALRAHIENKLVAYKAHQAPPPSGAGWDYPELEPYDYSESHGIAIYLPSKAVRSGYSELAWAAATDWDEFLNWARSK